MKKNFNILTIGCKANQYESQAFSDQMKAMGLIFSNKDADICIVNACAVTSNADKKSITAIKALKKKNKKAQFYLTGCIAKDVQDKLDDDIKIIPNSQKETLISQIFPDKKVPKFSIKNFDNHTRAFVKVQDGCDSYCSYCIIPFTRGRSRSRKANDILDEISKLTLSGYKEIVLTGINLGEYKSDISFAELLKRISKIQGIERIKLSSIHSHDITDELIDVLINHKKMSKFLHISLQSGSNRILKKMRRKYTNKMFLEKVKILTSLHSDFTFSTDLIVGFPSETIDDVDKTIAVIRKAKFTKVHFFSYSKRPNTLAAKFENQIDASIIKERKKMMQKEANLISSAKRETFINREMKVLFENQKDDYFVGTTENNLLVHVLNNEKISSNQILDVKLVKNMDGFILGELCK